MKLNACLASVVMLGSLSCPLALARSAAVAAQPLAASAGSDSGFDARLIAIDSLVLSRMQDLNLPGYALAIIKDGRVVFKKTYGYANLERSVPVTSDTVFGLASMTKTFTAFTLLTLVDRGQVELDAPLSRYIKGLSPSYQTLTIRQLASMRAGVPATVPREVAWKNQLALLEELPLVSEPDTQFLYSNFSYRLLGSVIASVTGRDYLDVVRETMLVPFGMSSTATTELLANTGRVAQGYGDNLGRGPVRPVQYKNPAVSYSAGMLASTQNDMVNYALALMQRPVLSPAGYQTLWYQRPPLKSGAPSNWAFGWGSKRRANMGGQLTIAMNGGTPGVASSVILLPESRCAVVALCNLRKPAVPALANQIALAAFGNQQTVLEEEELPGAGAD